MYGIIPLMVEILEFKAKELPLMYIEQYVDNRLEVYPDVVNEDLSVHQIWKRFTYKEMSDQIFIIVINEHLVAWLQLNDAKGKYWFNMLVVRDKQGLGFGSQLLEHVKDKVPNLHGWVVPHNNYFLFNREPYYSPLKFYEKCGFKVDPNYQNRNGIDVVEVTWER